MSNLQYKKQDLEEDNTTDYFDEDDGELTQTYSSEFSNSIEQKELTDENYFDLAEEQLEKCLHQMGFPTHLEQITAFETYVFNIAATAGFAVFGISAFFTTFNRSVSIGLIAALITKGIQAFSLKRTKDIFNKLPSYKLLKGVFLSRRKSIEETLAEDNNFYSIIYYLRFITYIFEKFGTQEEKVKKTIASIKGVENHLNQLFIKKDYAKLSIYFYKVVYPFIKSSKESEEFSSFILDKKLNDYASGIEGEFLENQQFKSMQENNKEPSFENIVSFLIKGKGKK